LQPLHGSAGPQDFHQARDSVLPEPEMHALIAGGGVAARGAHVAMLFQARRGDYADTRSNPIAIALRARRVHDQPVVAVAAPVQEDDRAAIVTVDRNIHETIVIDVAEGGPARRQCGPEDGAALRGDILESPVAVAHQ